MIDFQVTVKKGGDTFLFFKHSVEAGILSLIVT